MLWTAQQGVNKRRGGFWGRLGMALAVVDPGDGRAPGSSRGRCLDPVGGAHDRECLRYSKASGAERARCAWRTGVVAVVWRVVLH